MVVVKPHYYRDGVQTTFKVMRPELQRNCSHSQAKDGQAESRTGNPEVVTILAIEEALFKPVVEEPALRNCNDPHHF